MNNPLFDEMHKLRPVAPANPSTPASAHNIDNDPPGDWAPVYPLEPRARWEPPTDNPFGRDVLPDREPRKFPWGWIIAFVSVCVLVFLALALIGTVRKLNTPFLAPPSPNTVVQVGGAGAASQIVYEVTGRGTVAVEYTNGKGVTVSRNVTLPWKTDATAEVFYVELKVTRIGPDASPFECSVTSRGTQIGFGSADGPGAVCTAEGAQ